MSFCVYSILGVVKRTCWPTDLEEAKAGGFVVGYTPSGNPIFRNPCTEQILKLLDNLLALIRWVGIMVFLFYFFYLKHLKSVICLYFFRSRWLVNEGLVLVSFLTGVSKNNTSPHLHVLRSRGTHGSRSQNGFSHLKPLFYVPLLLPYTYPCLLL